MINNAKKVKEYYEQSDVAQNYIHKRFTEPLNIIEHQQQVKIINKIINDYKPSKVLELACGPARLTSDISHVGGISIDSSASMLKIARARTTKKWKFIQADILHDNLPSSDLIFTIRFILHFKQADRMKIYQQAKKSLKPQGLLVFEVMNKDVVAPLRKFMGSKRYFVYDKLFSKREFITELESNGFRVIKMYPILKNFWWQALLSRPFKILNKNKVATKLITFFEKKSANCPYQWIALCQEGAP